VGFVTLRTIVSLLEEQFGAQGSAETAAKELPVSVRVEEERRMLPCTVCCTVRCSLCAVLCAVAAAKELPVSVRVEEERRGGATRCVCCVLCDVCYNVR
jgi:hypothetical protein